MQLPPLAAPTQAGAWKAAQEFEAVALNQFLSPMFATVDLSDSPVGGGEAEQNWQSMLVSQMTRQVARAGGVGIARSVYGEILRMQEQGTAPPALPAAVPAGTAALPAIAP